MFQHQAPTLSIYRYLILDAYYMLYCRFFQQWNGYYKKYVGLHQGKERVYYVLLSLEVKPYQYTFFLPK